LTALVALAHGWLLAVLGEREASPVPHAAAARGVVTLALLPLPVAPSRDDAAAIVAAAPPPRVKVPEARPAESAIPSPSTAPVPTPAAVDTTPAELAGAVPAPQRDDGDPPPVYATRVPPPTALRFAARVNGVVGEAELRWQHDGQRYRLQLSVLGPARPLVEQLSEGGFDAAGVAPDRFVDRRHGRTVGAAHFRRDIGRIGFSGPRIDYPAWPGAQDRLAWLPQLVAVMAAAADPPDEVRFFVADARGIARSWVFRAQGSEVVESAAGPVRALKLLREPPRADDLRVAVWLDPARGHWPVRLAFSVPISGATFELTGGAFVALDALPVRAGP